MNIKKLRTSTLTFVCIYIIAFIITIVGRGNLTISMFFVDPLLILVTIGAIVLLVWTFIGFFFQKLEYIAISTDSISYVGILIALILGSTTSILPSIGSWLFSIDENNAKLYCEEVGEQARVFYEQNSLYPDVSEISLSNSPPRLIKQKLADSAFFGYEGPLSGPYCIYSRVIDGSYIDMYYDIPTDSWHKFDLN